MKDITNFNEAMEKMEQYICEYDKLAKDTRCLISEHRYADVYCILNNPLSTAYKHDLQTIINNIDDQISSYFQSVEKSLLEYFIDLTVPNICKEDRWNYVENARFDGTAPGYEEFKEKQLHEAENSETVLALNELKKRWQKFNFFKFEDFFSDINWGDSDNRNSALEALSNSEIIFNYLDEFIKIIEKCFDYPDFVANYPCNIWFEAPINAGLFSDCEFLLNNIDNYCFVFEIIKANIGLYKAISLYPEEMFDVLNEDLIFDVAGNFDEEFLNITNHNIPKHLENEYNELFSRIKLEHS